MDALTEISGNPIVLAVAGVVAGLTMVFEVRFALALARLSKTLKAGEQIPPAKFIPLIASGLVLSAAMLVIGLGLG